MENIKQKTVGNRTSEWWTADADCILNCQILSSVQLKFTKFWQFSGLRPYRFHENMNMSIESLFWKSHRVIEKKFRGWNPSMLKSSLLSKVIPLITVESRMYKSNDYLTFHPTRRYLKQAIKYDLTSDCSLNCLRLTKKSDRLLLG
jgi:hypothetical protein